MSEELEKSSLNVDPKIDELLNQYFKSRQDLIDDLKIITSLKDKMELLLPSSINFRNKNQLDDKLKILTGFFSTILSTRQEINRTIVQEIEIRRKLNPNKKSEELEEEYIRDIAEKIEGSNPINAAIQFPSDIIDEPSVLPDENNLINETVL